MTDPSADRKVHLALGIQSGLEKVDYSQLFPGPPESLEPDSSVITCIIFDMYVGILKKTTFSLNSLVKKIVYQG